MNLARTLARAAAVSLAPAMAMPLPASAAERPSFLLRGEVFCAEEGDFETFRRTGRVRAGSAAETCVVLNELTRVVVMRGQPGVKALVRVVSGPLAAYAGWTNGALPLGGS